MALPGFRARLAGVGLVEPSPAVVSTGPDVDGAWRDLLLAEFTLDPSHTAGSLVTWYATLADMAGSADLGFTAGSWSKGAAGSMLHGQFLTLWHRDSSAWHVTIDAGVSYAGVAPAAAKLTPDQPFPRPTSPPPAQLLEENAAGEAARDFWASCRQDGVAAGLRTYARNGDFLLLMDDLPPMGLKQADVEFTRSALSGNWEEDGNGRSADTTLAYSLGALVDDHRRSRRPAVQVWQFDPKVANWGLRVLLLGSSVPLSI